VSLPHHVLHLQHRRARLACFPLPPTSPGDHLPRPLGKCIAIDDTVPLEYRAPLPFGFAKMFVQSDFPGEPAKTAEYSEEQIKQTQGFYHPQGVAASFFGE
jgi:hypothetical protein